LPAASISDSVSWGMYVASAMMLVVALMPAIQGTLNYTARAESFAVADGIARVLNALRPGVVSVVGFESLWGNLTVRLSGHTESVPYGETEVQQYCRWSLPSVVLYPGRLYYAHLAGGAVEVSSSV